MKKTLALLLVASLLLAGCTELTDAVDDAGDEILKIDVDEDIALEKVEDFLTVDESESFGITVMYEIDMSEMGDDSGMLDVDENAIMNIEMTEAWSPDGYHSSSVMGMDDGDVTISMMTSMTHVGTTMYVSIGYEIDGELGADATEDEIAEFDMMVAMMPEVEHFSMTTTTTHTEVIAAMAEESAEDSEDMDPMAFLEMIEVIEEYGTFTPAESVDGLQLFDVAIDMAAVMEGEAPTPAEALDMCDDDNSDGVSWSEFISEDCDETDSEDMTELETLFNDADTDMSGELTVDELQAFIDSVTVFYEDDMEEGEMEDDMGMPAMQVAFTSTGDIEYFSMEMDEMGDEPTVMMMYILTEERVDALFTGLDAGETVALPFSLSDSMYDDDWDDDWGEDGDFYCNDGTTIPMDWVNDGFEDCADGEDETDMGGSDDEFMCDDGETIPMDWVNDGVEDCTGGEDEMDMGGSDDEFMCDDGETIPMDYVNDGEADCAGGEDEGYVWTYIYDNCSDSDDGLSSLDCWTSEMDVDGDGTPEDSDSYWNYECEQLADGTWECMTDHINYYDNCAYEDENYYECWLDEWDTDNNGSYDLGSDGYMDYECEQLADGRWACGHSEDVEVFQNYDNCDEESGMYECWNDDWVDSDGNVAITDTYELGDCSELADGTWDCLLMDADDGWPTFICGNGEEIPFDYVNDGEADCADGADEQQYDSDGNEINWFDCMDGSQIWISQVNDGTGDCPDGEDEMPDMSDDDSMDDGDMVCYNMSTHMVDPELTTQEDCEAAGLMWTEDQSDDYGGDDYSDEYVMYVTSEMDFHFEGDLSDYKIELATCESDYDMDTGEEITTCTTVMSVAIADAGMDSDIMFHDADSSGTLSVGDMIHIGEIDESWDEVRLYSISADAYSDENPMHDAPGFTGLVGMLALLGAAFIRRNE